MARDNLSELEGCVIGVVSRFGPCTAYRVRKEFQQSLTTSWRGSAGAIYPLLERLVARGLLGEKPIEGDARGARKLSITPKGRAALSHWIEDSADWLGEPAADPIRTRLQFLDQADCNPCQAIEEWLTETRSTMSRLEGAIETSEGHSAPLEIAALKGSWFQLGARLNWLQEVQSVFGENAAPAPMP